MAFLISEPAGRRFEELYGDMYREVTKLANFYSGEDVVDNSVLYPMIEISDDESSIDEDGEDAVDNSVLYPMIEISDDESSIDEDGVIPDQLMDDMSDCDDDDISEGDDDDDMSEDDGKNNYMEIHSKFKEFLTYNVLKNIRTMNGNIYSFISRNNYYVSELMRNVVKDDIQFEIKFKINFKTYHLLTIGSSLPNNIMNDNWEKLQVPKKNQIECRVKNVKNVIFTDKSMSFFSHVGRVHWNPELKVAYSLTIPIEEPPEKLKNQIFKNQKTISSLNFECFEAAEYPFNLNMYFVKTYNFKIIQCIQNDDVEYNITFEICNGLNDNSLTTKKITEIIADVKSNWNSFNLNGIIETKLYKYRVYNEHEVTPLPQIGFKDAVIALNDIYDY